MTAAVIPAQSRWRSRGGAAAGLLARRAWTSRLPVLGERPSSAIARRWVRRWQGIGFDPCHRCDKPVAAPRHRLDAAPLCSPVIKDAAQRRDLHVQVAVFDRRSRPDGLDDLGSREEIAWPLDQHAENVERARSDRHRSENTALIPPEQNTGAPSGRKPSNRETSAEEGPAIPAPPARFPAF
jgi:hypothetical protein